MQKLTASFTSLTTCWLGVWCCCKKIKMREKKMSGAIQFSTLEIDGGSDAKRIFIHHTGQRLCVEVNRGIGEL
jgi:hypothetical protein